MIVYRENHPGSALKDREKKEKKKIFTNEFSSVQLRSTALYNCEAKPKFTANLTHCRRDKTE